jgi:hypothetical protein
VMFVLILHCDRVATAFLRQLEIGTCRRLRIQTIFRVSLLPLP